MTDSEQLVEIKSLINHLVQDVEGIKKDVNGIKQDVDGIKQDIDGIKQDVYDLRQETTRTNDRVDTYQKASQQVVNLAFSLIIAATAAIVIPAVLGR